jgi:hypothetical protein
MTKLEEMWAALAKYQPYADADGNGKSWAEMCELRTAEAAFFAARNCNDPGASFAASYAGNDIKADASGQTKLWDGFSYSHYVVEHINISIEFKEKQND